MDSELAKLNVEEVCTLLRSNDLDHDVITIFRRNKITGCLMAELDDTDLTDLGIEAWGDRRKLRKIIQSQGGLASQAVAKAGTTEVSQKAQDTTDLCELISDDVGDKVGDMIGDSPPTLPTPLYEEDACSKRGQSASNLFEVQIISTVPDRLEGWEDGFEVPSQYSESSMLAISKGELTSAARREIVQAVASKMLNECKYPTRDQIEVVASKIVRKINGSKDSLGNGHGSWSVAIGTRLKNMRRQPRAKGAGLQFEPPTKRVKKSGNHCSELNIDLPFLDTVSYERHLRVLEKELKRSVKNRTAIRSLMKQMAPNRRQWVMEERPAVHEVLEMFPPLQEIDSLLSEFKDITKLEKPAEEQFNAEWRKWCPKILSYAKREKGQGLKTHLRRLEEPDELNDDASCIIVGIIAKMLDKRKKDAENHIIRILHEDDDIDLAMSSSEVMTPHIVSLEGASQFFIVCECQNITEVSTFSQAMCAVLATYYVFDIAYPKQCVNTLHFFERFIFGLLGGAKVPKTLIGVISDIQKITA